MNRRGLLQAGVAATAAMAAPRIGRAADQGALKFVPQADLASLDPMWTTSYVTRNHGYMVYDTLYGLDEQYRPRPQMVEGHTIGAEGLDWTLTLREGLRFHDNQPVLARDAIASIRRWGQRDPFGQALLAATAELSAPSDRVVRFRLRRPFPLLPNALGKAPSFMPCIMPERLAQTDAMTQVTESIGSGPFRFLVNERMQGSRFAYEKFTGYLPRPDAPSFTAGGKIARFDRVEWHVIPDAATAAVALRSGEVDWWEQPTADLLPMLRKAGAITVEVVDPTGTIGTIRFNTTQPPFDDPAIRRALLGAFNQADFMTAVAGTDKALWKDEVGYFSPTSLMASDAGLASLAPVGAAVVKERLAAAGYRGQKTVLLGASDYPSINALSQVAASVLQDAGMAVDYQAMDWGTVTQRVFDMLYGVNSKLEPQPQMAEGHTIEDGGRTWLIRLRPGLMFHDGTPVRASDCIAGLGRWSMRDPFGQLIAAALDVWDAPDDRTIRIRLKHPFPRLLDGLAKPVTPPFIMPARIAATPATTPVTEMVGSGPFRFLANEFIAGSRVAYARFDGYVPRQEPADWLAGGRQASFQRVEWHIIPDPATSAAALRAGEVDWWEWGLPDLLPRLARDPNLRVQITDKLGLYSILRFNMVVPPFNNPKLRRAIVGAVDQDDFMLPITANNRSGYRTCFAMLGCGLPHTRELGAELMKPPRDLERSRAAIREAGYTGQKVVILNPTDLPSLNPLGHVAADLLKKLGMNVDLQEMDWGTVVQRRSSTEPVERGGWSIFPTNGSPFALNVPPLNIYIRGQGAKGWVGGYDNPEIERLVTQWLGTSDAEQGGINDAIQRSAFESPPFVPLGQYFPQTVYRRDLTGIQDFFLPTPWSVRRA